MISLYASEHVGHPARLFGIAEVERHENAVWIGNIVSKRRAFHEPMTRVETAGRIKIFPRTGFQAEAHQPTFAGDFDDVAEHQAASSRAALGLYRVHGLYFAMFGRQPLQGPNAQKRLILPDSPYA